MIMVREVLNCRPGRVRDLVEKFKALGDVMREMGEEPFRIYTDVAGEPFWTVVLERDYASVEESLALEERVMKEEAAQAAMEGYHELLRSGRRELYRVEA
jgi:hypothetical protein